MVHDLPSLMINSVKVTTLNYLGLVPFLAGSSLTKDWGLYCNCNCKSLVAKYIVVGMRNRTHSLVIDRLIRRCDEHTYRIYDFY